MASLFRRKRAERVLQGALDFGRQLDEQVARPLQDPVAQRLRMRAEELWNQQILSSDALERTMARLVFEMIKPSTQDGEICLAQAGFIGYGVRVAEEETHEQHPPESRIVENLRKLAIAGDATTAIVDVSIAIGQEPEPVGHMFRSGPKSFFALQRWTRDYVACCARQRGGGFAEWQEGLESAFVTGYVARACETALLGPQGME